ncbi:hypothetical protein FGO68_gene2993 [Halteria grandinella]|uniref:Uncharacterized protein n=1 Tax=Halteria grandinella TaxID=5974 RepID=A0A8J8NIK2_HALGN|nr:hypothetical protein FGO68_gene2993 [Halteria grandinella]
MVDKSQPQEKSIDPYATFFAILDGVKLIGTIQERANTVGMLLDATDSEFYHFVKAGDSWAGFLVYKNDKSFVKDGVSFWIARQSVISQGPASFKDDAMKMVEQGETKQRHQFCDIQTFFDCYILHFFKRVEYNRIEGYKHLCLLDIFPLQVIGLDI